MSSETATPYAVHCPKHGLVYLLSGQLWADLGPRLRQVGLSRPASRSKSDLIGIYYKYAEGRE